MNIDKENKCYLYCERCHNVNVIEFNNIKHTFNINKDLYMGISCHCNICGWEMSEIDEGMFEIIILLNKKGYRTITCCSGHDYEDNSDGYILFNNAEHYLKIFDTLPDTWYLNKPSTGTNAVDKCTKYLMPEYDIRQKNKLGNHFTKGQLKKVNNDLLNWVKSLPNLENLK